MKNSLLSRDSKNSSTRDSKDPHIHKSNEKIQAKSTFLWNSGNYPKPYSKVGCTYSKNNPESQEALWHFNLLYPLTHDPGECRVGLENNNLHSWHRYQNGPYLNWHYLICWWSLFQLPVKCLKSLDFWPNTKAVPCGPFVKNLYRQICQSLMHKTMVTVYNRLVKKVEKKYQGMRIFGK